MTDPGSGGGSATADATVCWVCCYCSLSYFRLPCLGENSLMWGTQTVYAYESNSWKGWICPETLFLCRFAAKVALVKCRDLHWAMMAHRDQRDVSLSSLRMLIVTDGANPCECPLPLPQASPCIPWHPWELLLGGLIWGRALAPGAWAQNKRCCHPLGCGRSCNVGKQRVGWGAMFIKIRELFSLEKTFKTKSNP